MSSTTELKCIADGLQELPFKKKYTIYDIHDKLTYTDLLQLAWDVACHINANPSPLGIKPQDIKSEDLMEVVRKLSVFLDILNYTRLQEFNESINTQTNEPLLNVLYFLLKNIVKHTKRAYLSYYLTFLDIPEEFMYHEGNNNN